MERSVGQFLESSNQPSGMKTQGTDRTWLRLRDIKVSVSAMYPSRTGDVKTRPYGLHSSMHSRWVDGSKDWTVGRTKGGRDGQIV